MAALDAQRADDYGLPLRGASLPSALRRQFAGFFRFSGRASASEYWWPVLAVVVTVVVTAALALLGYALAEASETIAPVATGFSVVVAVLGSLAALVLVLGHIFVSIRRLHDANASGWWLLLLIVVNAFLGVGFIGGIVIGVLPAKAEGRRFD